MAKNKKDAVIEWNSDEPLPYQKHLDKASKAFHAFEDDPKNTTLRLRAITSIKKLAHEADYSSRFLSELLEKLELRDDDI